MAFFNLDDCKVFRLFPPKHTQGRPVCVKACSSPALDCQGVLRQRGKSVI